MTGALRILHLEDDPNDAELVAAILASDGLACEVVRAASRETFEAALGSGTYDVILSDYALPGFDGITAQALARERHPDVPFVFVSGTMGEEVAIERMQAGATDYVLKQRLSRLTPAVRRALEESRERRNRLRAEQANDFLEHLLAASPSIVFRLEPSDLRATFVSPNIGWLLGYTREEILGVPGFWESIVHPDDRESAMRGLREALESTVVQLEQEYRCRSKDGRYGWFFTLLRIEYDAAGRPFSILGYALDIADRKAAEAAADRANRAKSEFLSRMSHDLRTPLNAILGFAQILEMDPLPPAQADSVQQILKGGRHLLELVNEVLDIARIEAGQMSLSPEPVRLNDVLQQTTDLLHPLAAARGIAVSTEFEPGCSHCVRADRQRLKQVLLNLLGNAVKYNREAGRVFITCASAADGRVRVSVTDTGAGIPAEKLALVFRPFERLGAEATAIEGTGLGLAVAQGLMHAMDGTIGVHSQVDKGTTFWIELPAATEYEGPADDAPTEPASLCEPVAQGTILYVEDNRSNVRLLERLLGRRKGVRLITAPTGEEGIERVGRDHPDLVLLDLHLPDLPGEEVLRRLWSNPATRPVPIAVLSADATSSQRQRLLASGAVAYLTKPIDVVKLLAIIDERLDTRVARGSV